MLEKNFSNETIKQNFVNIFKKYKTNKLISAIKSSYNILDTIDLKLLTIFKNVKLCLMSFNINLFK